MKKRLEGKGLARLLYTLLKLVNWLIWQPVNLFSWDLYTKRMVLHDFGEKKMPDKVYVGFLDGSMVKNLPIMQEVWVQFLFGKIP